MVLYSWNSHASLQTFVIFNLLREYGSQEFISFDIYNNTLRYAAEKGFFNTDLNEDNW